MYSALPLTCLLVATFIVPKASKMGDYDCNPAEEVDCVKMLFISLVSEPEAAVLPLY